MADDLNRLRVANPLYAQAALDAYCATHNRVGLLAPWPRPRTVPGRPAMTGRTPRSDEAGVGGVPVGTSGTEPTEKPQGHQWLPPRWLRAIAPR